MSHPEVDIWETFTPYFDRRNIHFYINKLHFHAVEFFWEFNPDRNMDLEDEDFEPDVCMDPKLEGLFRFEKRMR